MNYYVYIIQETQSQSKPLKVGVASNVEKRRAQLQTGNPRVLSIVKTLGPFSRAEAYEIERDIHARFQPNRKVGEWFSWKLIKRHMLPKYIKEKGWPEAVNGKPTWDIELPHHLEGSLEHIRDIVGGRS